MKLMPNSGNDRTVDTLRKVLPNATQFDVTFNRVFLFSLSEMNKCLAWTGYVGGGATVVSRTISLKSFRIAG